MLKQLILLLLLIMNLAPVQAQQILLVKRRKPSLKYTFKEGEMLRIKLRESGEVLKGAWHYESENNIIIAGQIVPLPAICWVSVAKKEKGIWVLRKGQDMLVVTGISLFAIMQVNRMLSPKNFIEEKKGYRKSATLVTGGLICRGLDRTIRKRKVPVGKRFGMYLINNPS